MAEAGGVGVPGPPAAPGQHRTPVLQIMYIFIITVDMRRYEADLALPHPHVSEGVQQVAKVFILDYFTGLMIYLVTLYCGCCCC